MRGITVPGREIFVVHDRSSQVDASRCKSMLCVHDTIVCTSTIVDSGSFIEIISRTKSLLSGPWMEFMTDFLSQQQTIYFLLCATLNK